MECTVFKSGVFLTKIWIKITPFFICSASLCVKVLEKIFARTLCAMHHGVLSLYFIFNNDAHFLHFRAQKFPLIFFTLKPL